MAPRQEERVNETQRWLPRAGHADSPSFTWKSRSAPPSGPLLTGAGAHDRNGVRDPPPAAVTLQRVLLWVSLRGARSPQLLCPQGESRSFSFILTGGSASPASFQEAADRSRGDSWAVRSRCPTGADTLAPALSGPRPAPQPNRSLSCRRSVRCRAPNSPGGGAGGRAGPQCGHPPGACLRTGEVCPRAPQPGASCGLHAFTPRQHLQFIQHPVRSCDRSRGGTGFLGSWTFTCFCRKGSWPASVPAQEGLGSWGAGKEAHRDRVLSSFREVVGRSARKPFVQTNRPYVDGAVSQQGCGKL